MNRKNPFYKNPVFLSALSGVLLTLCFPGIKLGFLAWFALVPYLFALEKAQSKSEAVGYGLTFGMFFFAFSLHWLTYVTVLGWLGLAFLESAFILPFALGARIFLKNKNVFLRILAISLAWTSAELIRSEIPAFGLGANLLAYSQSDYAWVRMAANTAGAYGLGFVIVFVNACLFEIIRSKIQKKKINRIPLLFLPVIGFLLLAHGIFHYTRPGKGNETVRVSLLQGNIPQSVKWEVIARDKIIEIYSKLTELASYEQPDLIIWPEAAYPGYFNRDRDRFQILDLIKKTGTPTLVGSPHLEDQDTAYNSAYLVDGSGEIRQRYDKQHLVPFGEYVPLGSLLGWLKPLAYTLGVSDFTEGREDTVFQAMNGEFSFSVLICFEDVFPNMARRFADKGAQFLAVITNDAWFGPTAAGYIHEQASIFRAVENGIPVVRAANTGVSSFISYKGDVLARVKDSAGKEIFVTAKKTYDLPLVHQMTLYRMGGWIFPYAALAGFVILLVITEKSKNEKQRKS